MAVNLLAKQIPAVGLIQLKNADGSPLLDDDHKPCFARVHSPASKVWEAANAVLRRKAMKRVRDAGGKLEAASENTEDKLAFLMSVTEELVNVDIALPEGQTGAKALVETVLSNPNLGFIRDQIEAAAGDWGAFTEGSATS